jgi:DNA-binding transcriptional ArsR family regulator
MGQLEEIWGDFKGLTKIFKALSDETRFKLFTIIYWAAEKCDCKKDEWNEESCMKYLAEQLDVTMPTISHHIKELVNAGLVMTEKKGRWVSCRISPERLGEIRGFLDQFKEK